MNIIRSLANLTFGGIPTEAAFKVIETVWTELTRSSLEDVFIKSFERAIDNERLQLAAYAASDGDINIRYEDLRRLLRTELSKTERTATYQNYIEEEIIARLVAEMEANSLVIIGGHNLSRQGYSQIVWTTVNNARAIFQQTVRESQQHFQTAIVDLAEGNNELLVEVREHLFTKLDAAVLRLEQKIDDIKQHVDSQAPDFTEYLNRIVSSPQTIDIPAPIQEAYNITVERFPPDKLYHFSAVRGADGTVLNDDLGLAYPHFLQPDISFSPILIVGESGIGKSTLANQLLYDRARLCIEEKNGFVPLLVKLGQYAVGQSILDLIHIFLASNGAKINRSDLEITLHKSSFLIILDAFDEIIDVNLVNAEREISTLLDSYRNCRFIVTTRHFRLPKVSGFKTYELNTLSFQQTRAFAMKYVPENFELFLGQVDKTRLRGVASNTLTLTLLILIYLDEKTLPESRGQALDRIVSKVLNHNERKGARHHFRLRQEVLRQGLQKIAFHTVSRGSSYILPREIADQVAADFLADIVKRRLVKSEITIDEFFDYLASTGFVLQNSQGVAFWHRAFAEYFASSALIELISEVCDHLDETALRVEWMNIWPLCVSQLENPNELVKRLLHTNVFAAADVLRENPNIDIELSDQVIKILEKRCSSPWYYVRRTAMGSLLQQDDKRISDSLFRLLDSPYVDIKGDSLEAIARRHFPNAKEIVLNHLKWDVERELYFLGLGNSITSVITALAEFDDIDCQQYIMAIWKEKPDIFTSEYCMVAFFKLIDRNVIAKEVLDQLFDYYQHMEEDAGLSKTYEISRVLEKARSYDIGLKLVEFIKNRKEPLSYPGTAEYYAAEILIEYTEPKIIGKIIETYNSPTTQIQGRQLFADVLAKSKGQIPEKIILEMAQNQDYRIRASGIEALTKLAFADVQETILSAIHPPPIGESTDTPYSYAQVQAAAIESLAFFNHLELLLEIENQPEYFYFAAIEALFTSIQKAKLHNLVVIVDHIVTSTSTKDPRIVVEGARTLAELGYTQKAQDVIERLWNHNRSDSAVYEITHVLHLLSPEFSIKLLRTFLNLYKSKSKAPHIRSQCINALGHIHTKEACDTLAQIVWESVHSGEHILEPELALRNLQPFMSVDREDWLLDLLGTKRLERHDLRRAIETLGLAGTSKSLPLLRTYLESSDPHQQYISFWAIHEIYRREGVIWFNGEERCSGEELVS